MFLIFAKFVVDGDDNDDDSDDGVDNQFRMG